MDILVVGIYFLVQVNLVWVVYKVLVLNISDLVVMGVILVWVLFVLILFEIDDVWLMLFCDVFFELVKYYNVQFIGGDIIKGLFSIILIVQGFLFKEQVMLCSGVKVGDWFYVMGDLGDS